MATSTSVANLNVQRKQGEVGNSLTRVALRRLRRDKLTLLAMSIVALIAILSILAPVISNALKVSYQRTDASITFLPLFSPGHVLGTDDLGRDHLSRLLYAGQVSLAVGFISAMLSMSIGVSLGIITGYYGGIVDDIVTWVISTLNSIPSLFLLL